MERKDAFQQRGTAFEATYFSRKDAELIAKLKSVFRKQIDKLTIRDSTGVSDEALLDRLIELNLDGELMAAFNVLPIIEIAWADGHVDDLERQAVLKAAEKHHILPGTKAYAMLDARLREGPVESARKLWYHYAEALRSTLSPEELSQYRKDLLDTCWSIAEASGGLLNIAFRVSANEKKVIDAVERALTA